MKEMRFKYSIAAMCRFVQVSKSGYYKWLNRKPSKRVREEGRLEVEIKGAHQRTRETCGAERLQHELKDQGVKVGICRIRRIRKKLGIRCKQKRKFKATTDSKHALPVAENLVHQQFEAARPNEIWLSDITYIPTEEGWLYLCRAILTMESFSRQFQLNKEEKEAASWGWNKEGGDTMFHVVNAYTRGAQFESLSAASGFKLQKVGGMILGMVQ